ncbi:hypothetical protein A7Q01_02300 [Eikenella sp. NML96-A-049]|nr:hypothetical protein A7P97_07630 [Eikenella sp. NML070372]OAM41785.1 hypothetical protein A7Q01_02300 [Eikenella sp. NML96-A-049]
MRTQPGRDDAVVQVAEKAVLLVGADCAALDSDVWYAEAFVEFPARLAALADFEVDVANLLVAEANLLFACTFDAEVFAEAGC